MGNPIYYNSNQGLKRIRNINTNKSSSNLNTKLLMHFDGENGSTAFIDECGKLVIPHGNTYISNVQSKFGGTSGYFDGSGDYLIIPYSSDFDITAGDFTIDWWQYEISRYTWSTPFSLSSLGSQTISDCTYINTGSYDNNAHWLVGNGGNTWAVHITFVLPSLNTWHHYALVRSGDNFIAFVDGQIAGSATYSGNIKTPTNPIILGCVGNLINYEFFNGYIDEFRIGKGVAYWKNNFVPPTSPYIYISKKTNTIYYDSDKKRIL